MFKNRYSEGWGGDKVFKSTAASMAEQRKHAAELEAIVLTELNRQLRGTNQYFYTIQDEIVVEERKVFYTNNFEGSRNVILDTLGRYHGDKWTESHAAINNLLQSFGAKNAGQLKVDQHAQFIIDMGGAVYEW